MSSLDYQMINDATWQRPSPSGVKSARTNQGSFYFEGLFCTRPLEKKTKYPSTEEQLKRGTTVDVRIMVASDVITRYGICQLPIKLTIVLSFWTLANTITADIHDRSYVTDWF